MRQRRFLVSLTALTVIAAGCAATTTSTPQVTLVEDETATSAARDTAAAPVAEATTTTVALPLELDLSIEPADWEDVTITTEDAIDLHGKFWEGGDTALLVSHDFDNPTPGSGGQRPPQDSTVALPYTAALAREGLTVLTFDFRGHGQSAGEYNVQESQIDLAAAYGWLVDAGYEKIIMIGWVGSGTSAVVLDAESDEINFAGIAMLFSPPQDTGLDANRALPELEIPLYFVGTEAGRTASWSRRMEARAVDSRGVYVFEQVPTGVTFFDVFGPELAGRIFEFVEGI